MNVSMLGALFGIDTWFYELLYSMMQGILKLCDTVYQVVIVLCGMKKNTESGDGLLESEVFMEYRKATIDDLEKNLGQRHFR